MWNCGIMGGSRNTIYAAVSHMAARISEHYAQLAARTNDTDVALTLTNQNSTKKKKEYVVDMLALHEMAIELAPTIVTGYPHGLVNLPMHGDMCSLSRCITRNRSYPYVGREDCDMTCCTKHELADMIDTHFFRHKLGCGRTIPCGRPIA